MLLLRPIAQRRARSKRTNFDDLALVVAVQLDFFPEHGERECRKLQDPLTSKIYTRSLCWRQRATSAWRTCRGWNSFIIKRSTSLDLPTAESPSRMIFMCTFQQSQLCERLHQHTMLWVCLTFTSGSPRSSATFDSAAMASISLYLAVPSNGSLPSVDLELEEPRRLSRFPKQTRGPIFRSEYRSLFA